MKINMDGVLIVLFAVVFVWWLVSFFDTDAFSDANYAASPDVEELNLNHEVVIGDALFARNKETIEGLMAIDKVPLEDIRSFGYGAIPVLTELYEEAESNTEKYRISGVFWRLGWKSPKIEQALIDDLDASDATTKVWAQWAIAKSTQSDDVIKKVLYNLENDSSPFVRDKAACALASDFIHVSPTQRLIILRGLVKGLGNEITQVRKSSILALKIQTGQTKNYNPTANVSQRDTAIEAWNTWLDDYESNL